MKVPPRLENSNPYRSHQNCPALSSRTAATRTDTCRVAGGVIFRPGPDNRMPPNRYCTTTTATMQTPRIQNSQRSTSWIIGRVNT